MKSNLVFGHFLTRNNTAWRWLRGDNVTDKTGLAMTPIANRSTPIAPSVAPWLNEPKGHFHDTR